MLRSLQVTRTNPGNGDQFDSHWQANVSSVHPYVAGKQA